MEVYWKRENYFPIISPERTRMKQEYKKENFSVARKGQNSTQIKFS